VTATVTVFVTDVNDHAPTFPAQLVELTVSEAAPLDARLSLLPALDYDLATNSVQVHTDSVRNVAFGCPLRMCRAVQRMGLRDAWALCRLDGGRGERRGREQVQRNRATPPTACCLPLYKCI